MKNILLIIWILVFTLNNQSKLIAQSDTLSFKGKSSLLFELYGPELIGCYFNYFLSNHVSVNTGVGINLSCHLGTNLYLIRRNKSRHSMYLGGQIAYLRKVTWNITGFGGSIEPGNQIGFYLPVGYEFTGKKHFTIHIDVGPNFVSEDWAQSNTYPINFSIKIGKTFGFE